MNSAIYAGSFDPVTNGHVDVIKRAQKLFDQVIVGVIENPDKEAFFSIEDRIQFIRETFKGNPNILVEGFQGLLVDFARVKGVHTLVRGLRAVSDFDYEFQMALTNRTLYPELDTIFLMTDTKYAYLSSSLIKHLAGYHAEISELVPDVVENVLRTRFKKEAVRYE